MPEPIKIDVWSDVACPWCYIGKRNLDAALASFADAHPDAPVDVVYRSFQLAPDAPERYDGSLADYLSSTRGLAPDQVEAMIERPRQAAERVGIEMDFASLKPARTARAHALLQMARQAGRQQELGELLFRANFEEGRSLGDPEELLSIAVEAGLDRDAARRAIEGEEFAPAVEADQEKAHEYGIGGVPFFVISDRFGIAGAQPAEVLEQALEQVLAEHEGA